MECTLVPTITYERVVNISEEHKLFTVIRNAWFQTFVFCTFPNVETVGPNADRLGRGYGYTFPKHCMCKTNLRQLHCYGSILCCITFLELFNK